MKPIKIVVYRTKSNKEPYYDWVEKLDKNSQAIIKNRIDRMTLNNFGDAKLLKNAAGVWELRINWGPGYRVYYGKKGSTIVLLLLGGDKGSQDRDIIKAKRYWLDGKDML